MTNLIQICSVQRSGFTSLQNVCANYFEIECQPRLVASLNTSPRPCACMGSGPFLISPAKITLGGAISFAEPCSQRESRKAARWRRSGAGSSGHVRPSLIGHAGKSVGCNSAERYDRRVGLQPLPVTVQRLSDRPTGQFAPGPNYLFSHAKGWFGITPSLLISFPGHKPWFQYQIVSSIGTNTYRLRYKYRYSTGTEPHTLSSSL